MVGPAEHCRHNIERRMSLDFLFLPFFQSTLQENGVYLNWRCLWRLEREYRDLYR